LISNLYLPMSPAFINPKSNVGTPALTLGPMKSPISYSKTKKQKLTNIFSTILLKNPLPQQFRSVLYQTQHEN